MKFYDLLNTLAMKTPIIVYNLDTGTTPYIGKTGEIEFGTYHPLKDWRVTGIDLADGFITIGITAK